MKPQDLLNLIGQQYQKLDENGKALGCMAPVYALYPEIPHYEWPEEGATFAESVLTLLKKHGTPIEPRDIMPGDVVVFRMPFGFEHIGVYMGNDLIVHCMTGESLEQCRFSFICKRLDGVFRWEGGG